MQPYLCEARVLLKDFGGYEDAEQSDPRRGARERRPARYLHSTALRKEALARTLAERDRVEAGLIGLFDICLNGRLWLARQLDRAGLGYVQRDNGEVRPPRPSARPTGRAHRVRYFA